MKLQNLVTMIFISSLIASCGNRSGQASEATMSPLEEEEVLWDEVMAIHDEVMPKVSNINRISRQLRDHMGSEDAIESEAGKQLKTTVQQLEKAEEDMWAWMNNLKQLERLRQETDHDGVMRYLTKEKEKIQRVRDTMLGAIEAGEQLKKTLGIE